MLSVVRVLNAAFVEVATTVEKPAAGKLSSVVVVVPVAIEEPTLPRSMCRNSPLMVQLVFSKAASAPPPTTQPHRVELALQVATGPPGVPTAKVWSTSASAAPPVTYSNQVGSGAMPTRPRKVANH